MKREIHFTEDLLNSCKWDINDGEKSCSTPFGEVIEDKDGELWLLAKNNTKERLHISSEGRLLLVSDTNSDTYTSLFPKVEYDNFFEKVIDLALAYKFLFIITVIVAYIADIFSISRYISVAVFLSAIFACVHIETGEKSLLSILKSFALTMIIYTSTLFLISAVFIALFITYSAMGITQMSDALEFLVGEKSAVEFFRR
jgi:hypothetical protein